jgi:hypothetical protein
VAGTQTVAVLVSCTSAAIAVRTLEAVAGLAAGHVVINVVSTIR